MGQGIRFCFVLAQKVPSITFLAFITSCYFMKKRDGRREGTSEGKERKKEKAFLPRHPANDI